MYITSLILNSEPVLGYTWFSFTGGLPERADDSTVSRRGG